MLIYANPAIMGRVFIAKNDPAEVWDWFILLFVEVVTPLKGETKGKILPPHILGFPFEI